MPKTLSELAQRLFRVKPDELNDAQSRVLKSTLHRRPIAQDQNEAFDERTSTGDRIADSLARVGGSWSFIIGFLLFLIIWSTMNVWLLGRDAFDPYPFIFLNLLLSMIAAIQAPIIMMSQNRQAVRDRLEAAHDYEINLKAEIEIMALHEKLDELRHTDVLNIRDRVDTLSAQLERIERMLTNNRSVSGE